MRLMVSVCVCVRRAYAQALFSLHERPISLIVAQYHCLSIVITVCVCVDVFQRY